MEEDAWARTYSTFGAQNQISPVLCLYLECLSPSIFWFHLGFPFHVNLTEFHGRRSVIDHSGSSRYKDSLRRPCFSLSIPLPVSSSLLTAYHTSHFFTTFLTSLPCVLLSSLLSPPSFSPPSALQFPTLLLPNTPHLPLLPPSPPRRSVLHPLESLGVIPRLPLGDPPLWTPSSVVSPRPLDRSQTTWVRASSLVPFFQHLLLTRHLLSSAQEG